MMTFSNSLIEELSLAKLESKKFSNC